MSLSFLRIFSITSFESGKSLFRIQKIGWGLLGFWIGSDLVSKVRFTVLILNCIEVLLYGIFQLSYVYERRDNLNDLLDGLTPFITQVPCVIRLLILVWYRNDLRRMLDYLRDIFEKTTDRSERELNARRNRMSSMLLGFMMFCVVSTDMGYISYPIISNILRFFNGHELAYDLPFKAAFPFDYNYFPLYPIVYFLSMHAGNMTVCSICAVEGIILGTCHHLAAQFEIISLRITRLLSEAIDEDAENSPEPFAVHQNAKIYSQLIAIVKMHSEAIEMCETLSKILWRNILMQLVFAAFIMSVSALMILQSSDVGMLIYIFYIISYVLMLFNYALCGNTLIEATTRIQQTVYDFPWYRCDMKVRKALLLIMVRSQRKVNLKVPFFEITLETFAKILRVFSSCFTMARNFM